MRLISLFVVLALFTVASATPIPLRDVTALTLHKSNLTSDGFPQLHCLSDERRCSHAPAVVQCQQVGWDGQQAQWRCETLAKELPDGLDLAAGEVVCKHASEGHVVAGSCSYHYHLRGNPPLNAQEAILMLLVAFVLVIFFTALGCGGGRSNDNFWLGYMLGGSRSSSSVGFASGRAR